MRRRSLPRRGSSGVLRRAAAAALVAAALALAPAVLAAQEVRPADPIPVDSIPFGLAPADTVPVLAPRFLEAGGLASLAEVPGEDVLPKNPRNAAIRAFLLPGWGQIYTGHPWRAALFATGEIGFLTLAWQRQQDALDLQDDLQAAREEFFATLPDSLKDEPGEADAAFDETTEAVVLRSELADVEERREDWYAYFALSVIFAAVDAYVAAQLDPLRLGMDAEGRARAGVTLPLGPAPPRRSSGPASPRVGP